MIYKFRHPAGPYTIFSPDVVDGLIGQTFTAKLETVPIGEGKVIDAQIIDKGTAIEFTVEWPDAISLE